MFIDLTIETIEDIASILNDCFASVLLLITTQFTERVDVHKTCLSSINCFPSAVEEKLELLKPTTSTGRYGISNVLLKHCAMSLAVPLSQLCDTSFKDGVTIKLGNSKRYSC